MLSVVGGSLAIFAMVWALICLLAGAVVTDAMLRDASAPEALDVGLQGDATEA